MSAVSPKPFVSQAVDSTFKTTERSPNVPRDSLWYNKMWMDRTNNDSISSDSASTSTLVDEMGAGVCLDVYDGNDLADEMIDIPRIPTPRQSDYDVHELYPSPFSNTSTVYSDMPEIPFVPVVHARHRRSPTVDDQSFWSTLVRPSRARHAKSEPIFGLASERSIAASRCAPPLSPSPSVSSTTSSQTKVMPIKSSLSSSSSLKSKDGSSRKRKQQISVKFAEKPTIHYDHSYDTEPESPTPQNTTSPKAPEGGLSKLKRLIGSMRKHRDQAVPGRPCISGPYPMYCMASTRVQGQNVRPARSHASLRSAGSARSASSFRIFWHRLTCPDG